MLITAADLSVAMSSDSESEDYLLFQEFKKWKEQSKHVNEDGKSSI